MFEAKKMMYLYVETPLHAGSGSSLGLVDLPIQRERTTGYPLVQASGLKGCLREAAEAANGRNNDKVKLVFGPDTQGAAEHAGALSVGDARLLLFPVRSLMGVFAWTTSQDALSRFARDAALAGVTIDWTPTGPSQAGQVLVTPGNAATAQGRVVLEEFAYTAQDSDEVKTIAEWLERQALPTSSEYNYWREALPKRLVILPENDFRDFVQFSTEVITRIRLDDQTKTVERGALWTEEHLPTDTLLYAPLFASKPRVNNGKLPSDWQQSNNKAGAVLEFVKTCVNGKRLQLGGDSTVGRGFVAVCVS